jgi:hypothetical protein
MHKFREPDRGKRLQYFQWLKHVASLDKIYFTDEAWFHISLYVNSQNNQVWNAENPYMFHEQL